MISFSKRLQTTLTARSVESPNRGFGRAAAIKWPLDIALRSPRGISREEVSAEQIKETREKEREGGGCLALFLVKRLNPQPLTDVALQSRRKPKAVESGKARPSFLLSLSSFLSPISGSGGNEDGTYPAPKSPSRNRESRTQRSCVQRAPHHRQGGRRSYLPGLCHAETRGTNERTDRS